MLQIFSKRQVFAKTIKNKNTLMAHFAFAWTMSYGPLKFECYGFGVTFHHLLTWWQNYPHMYIIVRTNCLFYFGTLAYKITKLNKPINNVVSPKLRTHSSRFVLDPIFVRLIHSIISSFVPFPARLGDMARLRAWSGVRSRINDISTKKHTVFCIVKHII